MAKWRLTSTPASTSTGTPTGSPPAPQPAAPAAPKHFYGTVKIDAARMNRDAGQISQEVVQHLVAILMANVEVTLEIQATAPDGFPPNVIRTISENCRTLKFTQHDFNFDPFIEDALKACRPHVKDVVTVNRASGDIAAFSPHNLAQVVYLHGAYEYYRDRNSITETQRLDDDLVHKIRNMVSYAPLVVCSLTVTTAQKSFRVLNTILDSD